MYEVYEMYEMYEFKAGVSFWTKWPSQAEKIILKAGQFSPPHRALNETPVKEW